MKDNLIYKILKTNLLISIIALIIGLISQTIEFLICKGCSLTTHTASHYISFTNIGLFLIIITPVLRIFLELCFFIKEKNNTYIIICLILFAIIAISIII